MGGINTNPTATITTSTISTSPIPTTTIPTTTFPTTNIPTTTTVAMDPWMFSIYCTSGGSNTALGILDWYHGSFVNIGNSVNSGSLTIPDSGLYELSFYVSVYVSGSS